MTQGASVAARASVHGGRALLLALTFATVPGAGAGPAPPPESSPGQQGRFRSAVDVIAVDVQVVGDQGHPIGPLGVDAFEVSINGHRRKLVSAQFIRHASADPVPSTSPAHLTRQASDPTPPVVEVEPTLLGGGRTFILAIDDGSFDVGTARGPMEAVERFLRRLDPTDRVGLYVGPAGAWIPPTTQRAPIRARLDAVIGAREALRSYYNLSPSEIVDITAQATNPNSFLVTRNRIITPEVATEMLDPVRRIERRECPGDETCLARIYADGMQLAVQLENQTQASLGGLEWLLRQLADIPGRKAVVFVSAGVLVSDRPDGRPDVGDLARIMGHTAARANATVYTMHVESRPPGASASRRSAGSSEQGRDRAMFGNFLDAFSNAAGGKLIYVSMGGGDVAFERVLRESSAYYLLGVEPAEADRDGQPRELRVKVHRRDVTVRSRRWVLVPKRER